MDARLLVEALASRGIHIAPGDGQLVVEPASTLTDEDRQLLRRFKPDLLALLQSAPGICSWCEVSLADAAEPDANGAAWCNGCREAELDAQRNPRSLATARSLHSAWTGAVFELAGFPPMPYKPGHSVTEGESGWRVFAAHGSVDDLRRALEALRAVVEALPPPRPGGTRQTRTEDGAE